ncbi:hypothetical protein AM593_01654, partial [Mytilus galloprovincialis]
MLTLASKIVCYDIPVSISTTVKSLLITLVFQDVVVRVCFILGNMTAKNDDARLRLFQENKSMDALLAIMKYYLDRDIKDVVVRVCFILGNMTAKNDDARLRLFQENKSMDALLAIMKYYLDRDIKIKSREKEKEISKQDSSKGNDCEDVLIKTVRVVANMSINEMVGPVLASNQQFVELLLNILGKYSSVLILLKNVPMIKQFIQQVSLYYNTKQKNQIWQTKTNLKH